MARYSISVWKMSRQILIQLGGENDWIPLHQIVEKVREKWRDENVNPQVIRLQVRSRCVNGHPGHDAFPGHGKMWKKQPTFVSNHSGAYRIYNEERDNQIYKAAIAEDQVNLLPEIKPEVNKKSPQALDLPPKPSRIENTISLLEQCGIKLGFKTQREWEVPMGRIDLVWYYDLPINLPQVETSKIPIVGFELETGWRTRKHIKGDILNFQAIHVPLGVIVQQTGQDNDAGQVEGLIRNTREFLRKLGMSNLYVWTDEDLIKLCNALAVIADKKNCQG